MRAKVNKSSKIIIIFLPSQATADDVKVFIIIEGHESRKMNVLATFSFMCVVSSLCHKLIYLTFILNKISYTKLHYFGIQFNSYAIFLGYKHTSHQINKLIFHTIDCL
jgi:hypothetical protein